MNTEVGRRAKSLARVGKFFTRLHIANNFLQLPHGEPLRLEVWLYDSSAIFCPANKLT